jgi:hypothetical protein
MCFKFFSRTTFDPKHHEICQKKISTQHYLSCNPVCNLILTQLDNIFFKLEDDQTLKMEDNLHFIEKER